MTKPVAARSAIKGTVDKLHERRRKLISDVLRVLGAARSIALLDQLVVSGVSFLATVAVARASNLEELGAYAIGVSVLAVLISFQDSVILTPYTVQRDQSGEATKTQAGAALGLTVLLAGLVALSLSLFVFALGFFSAPPHATNTMFALAAAAPFVLMREFGRRYAFAHLLPMRAVAQDAIVSAVQICTLGLLFLTGHMTAVTAILALGFACLITNISWFFRYRRELVFDWKAVRKCWSKSWHFGKWLAGSRLGTNIQGYAPYWLTTVFFGPAATGIYAASMSIIAFSNPIIFGLGNVLTPRTAFAWKTGGPSALWAVAVGEARLLGILAGAFGLLVALAGDQIMVVLYNGPEFAGHRQILIVLALAVVALALGRPPASGLATLERSKDIFRIALVATIPTFALAVALTFWWGLVGAAGGYLLANVINTTGRWVAFRRALVRTEPSEPEALPSLDAIFSRPTDDRLNQNSVIEKLGTGDHATAYRISAPDGAPVWRDHSSIVVKLYRHDIELGTPAAFNQFEAMARLHNSLGGGTLTDWNVHAATPLKFSDHPLAIVMAFVDGQDFDSCDWQENDPRPAAGALVAAMFSSWRAGEVHGDFGLQNILFDTHEQHIGLIDPGTFESCPTCHSSLDRRNAAALDIGHMLADLARDRVHLRGNSAERSLRNAFVINVLEAAIDGVGARGEQTIFMRAIKTSVNVHLTDLARRARGAKRIWLYAVLPIKRTLTSMILAKISSKKDVFQD